MPWLRACWGIVVAVGWRLLRWPSGGDLGRRICARDGGIGGMVAVS